MFSQQSFTYDTATAQDCSRDRYLSIAGKSVRVPKNTIFKMGRFVGYTPGMGFGMAFDLIEGQRDTFYSYCNSFSILIFNDIKNDDSFYQAENGYYYNKHSPLKKDSFYQFLLSYNHYNDTFIQECICAPGLGWNLIDYQSPGKSFKELCPPYKGSCMCDSTMYGTFKDFITGEELRIVQNPLSVEYRSKKQPHWKTLYIHHNTPGFLLIGFTADASSFSQLNYELKFNGECWIIPSISSCMKERNRLNPQFFKRL